MSPTIILISVLVLISVFCGWFSSRNKSQERAVTVMLFVLYFWGSAFVQLIIFALLYHFGFLQGYF